MTDKAAFSMPVLAVSGGNVKAIILPGSNKFTKIIPKKSETKVADKNHNNVLPPILPTAFKSPNLATPTTNVAKTKGEIIILTKFRKISLKMGINSTKPATPGNVLFTLQ